MDYNIKLANGKVLRGFISSPGEGVKAVIVFVHGLGEHILRYRSWAEMFTGNGIAFTGVDLPGHGNSDGKRGHIKSYNLTDEMIGILLNSVSMTFPSVPVFLYGQSLGGGIVLRYILAHEPDITGAIVTSPWLKLSFEPDKFKIFLASVMKNILPAFTQSSGLVIEHLSHNRDEVDKYGTDPLVHGKISVSLFYNALEAAKESLEYSGRLKIPLLLMHGSDDKICSPEGSRIFASKEGPIDFKIWEGGYHELHNEMFRDDVFAYISGWINEKLNKK